MRFLAILLSLAMATGQSTFRHDVKLVRLLVGVKNQAGELVGSLDRDAFEVYDCGVKQEIAIFERQTVQPLSVSVLMDTSWSTLKDVKLETNSLSKFFKSLLKEGNTRDAAALYSFSYDVTQLHGFTRNLSQLVTQLGRIKSAAGTSLYNAVHFAGHDIQGREGRHVMVIVSDGGDTTSHWKYQDALEAAQKADAVIYPVIVVPVTNDAGRNTGGEHALQQFASNTGGRVLWASNQGELDHAFDEILLDLRTQYLIAYYPKEMPKDAPRFHPLKVELKRPELRASTRSGYYGDVVP